MTEITLYRPTWAISYSRSRLELGQRILTGLLLAKLPKSSPLLPLQDLCRLGLTLTQLIEAIRLGGPDFRLFEEEFLIIESPMERSEKKRVTAGYTDAILLPKSVLESSLGVSLKAFCHTTPESLARLVSQTLGFSEVYQWSKVLSALEATTLKSTFPPLLLAIFNFTIDVANPAGVSRTPFMPLVRKNKSGNGYPEFTALKHRLEDKRKERSSVIGSVFAAIRPSTGDDALLCRIAKFYDGEFVPFRQKHDRNFAEYIGIPVSVQSVSAPQVSSMLRYLREFPRALQLVRDAKFEGPMGRILRRVARIIWASEMVNVHPDFKSAYLTPIVSTPRDLPLLDPDEILDEFGLEEAPPTYAELQKGNDGSLVRDGAFRLLRAILVHGFQRHCSLICIELQHFNFGRNFSDLRIVWSKTGDVNQSLPLWALFPEEELRGARDLIRYCLNDLKLPGDTRLMEVAGIGTFEKIHADRGQLAFCKRMEQKFPLFAGGTHISRATGLSWAAVRVYLALYPGALNCSVMDRYRDAVWFSQGELAKFRKLLVSECTDAVEVLRRVACWSTPQQLIESYARSWHILAELHVYMARQQT